MSPSFSPAGTTTWCKRRKIGSRFCASRSSYQLWKSPFVKVLNAAQRATTASACCNSHAGAARPGGNESGDARSRRGRSPTITQVIESFEPAILELRGYLVVLREQ